MTAIGIVILVFAFTTLGVVMFIYALYSLIQSIVDRIHAKKNGISYNEEESEEHIDTCPYCSRDFVWVEKDIIVKYAPGRGYKVPCPYCNKLLHVYDE